MAVRALRRPRLRTPPAPRRAGPRKRRSAYCNGAGGRRLVAHRREHLAHVHRVEAVLQAAELAAHLDLAALGDDAVASPRGPARAACCARARASSCRQSAAVRGSNGAASLPRTAGAASSSASSVSSSSRVSVAASMGDAVEVLVEADLVLVALGPGCRSPSTGMRWISSPAATSSLAASTSRVSSCSRLQHVVLEHLRQLLQRLALVAMQRHHALVGLLAGQPVLGVERDRAAALAVHVEQRLQPRVVGTSPTTLAVARKLRSRLHLGHRQLHRAVAEDLQHQRAVELDVGLHQHAGRGHLAEQRAHRRRVARRASRAGAAPPASCRPGAPACRAPAGLRRGTCAARPSGDALDAGCGGAARSRT